MRETSKYACDFPNDYGSPGAQRQTLPFRRRRSKSVRTGSANPPAGSSRRAERLWGPAEWRFPARRYRRHRHVELPVRFARFVSPGQAKLGVRPTPGPAP